MCLQVVERYSSATLANNIPGIGHNHNPTQGDIICLIPAIQVAAGVPTNHDTPTVDSTSGRSACCTASYLKLSGSGYAAQKVLTAIARHSDDPEGSLSSIPLTYSTNLGTKSINRDSGRSIRQLRMPDTLTEPINLSRGHAGMAGTEDPG
ncbi:hypothetical protein AC578_663 [Pseudocercospora eumusae]|uniref:Uncharacterized protein n=1 Tax=Pseudocercospora eumusae TaxID=321146 RepID=A0A139HKL4_9PEZI|nr:hypothetical protein AC578_663 [Pseudocercospora eumusae]